MHRKHCTFSQSRVGCDVISSVLYLVGLPPLRRQCKPQTPHSLGALSWVLGAFSFHSLVRALLFALTIVCWLHSSSVASETLSWGKKQQRSQPLITFGGSLGICFERWVSQNLRPFWLLLLWDTSRSGTPLTSKPWRRSIWSSAPVPGPATSWRWRKMVTWGKYWLQYCFTTRLPETEEINLPQYSLAPK